ncbi:aspartate carbamoyltransferase [Salsuginibacillus halophilus]|uniref:Aspartate carbamoyltransferase n=1 Tax=Salsuginibacillus halophilus TaxID=517424 RepID=A0A2P8HWZ7_9BACI|nr:aspartate carbamoyltransferase catalytic subunit [Salsuginibacillus halophilus]PSL50750.1 aspartate carbamoyltransferase [Salsuginibacillus halophilus]
MMTAQPNVNGRHLWTLMEMDEGDILDLLNLAKRYKEGLGPELEDQPAVANLFFEPSTRTKMSFEMAEKRLGLSTLDFSADHSSAQKGESLYDTAKTLEAIGAGALVIRHGEERYFDQLNSLSIPVINGGDGCGHHPTQSLLDLFTIEETFGGFRGLHIVVAGDITHSRVARSNIEVLKRLGARVSVTGPPSFAPGSETYIPMDEACRKADVLMLLRVQHERHTDGAGFSAEAYHKAYGLTKRREKEMKPGSIIMHPAPVNRGVEIDADLVETDRSRIFTQMENGVYTRMAVLYHALADQKATKGAMKR